MVWDPWSQDVVGSSVVVRILDALEHHGLSPPLDQLHSVHRVDRILHSLAMWPGFLQLKQARGFLLRLGVLVKMVRFGLILGGGVDIFLCWFVFVFVFVTNPNWVNRGMLTIVVCWVVPNASLVNIAIFKILFGFCFGLFLSDMLRLGAGILFYFICLSLASQD